MTDVNDEVCLVMYLIYNYVELYIHIRTQSPYPLMLPNHKAAIVMIYYFKFYFTGLYRGKLKAAAKFYLSGWEIILPFCQVLQKQKYESCQLIQGNSL